MKNLYLLFLLPALLFAFEAEATIWRVNLDGSGDFTTPQGAHDAASSGDTLHIEGAAGVYETLTISKEIIVIGKGHSLDDNLGLQARAELSTIPLLRFAAGSDGSKIYGLNITNYIDLGVASAATISNVTISRNFIRYIYFRTTGNLTNFEISHNLFFYASNANVFSYQFTGVNSNFLIANNLFLSARVTLSSITGTFEHNIMINGSSHSFDSFVLRNNIAVTTGTINFTNCVVESNMGAGTQFGSINGNQSNVTMSTVFETFPITLDNHATLKAGSPAIGAGVGGVDLGIFGGANPYRISGIPGVPTIYSLSGTVNGNVLQVVISTRSNN